MLVLPRGQWEKNCLSKRCPLRIPASSWRHPQHLQILQHHILHYRKLPFYQVPTDSLLTHLLGIVQLKSSKGEFIVSIFVHHSQSEFQEIEKGLFWEHSPRTELQCLLCHSVCQSCTVLATSAPLPCSGKSIHFYLISNTMCYLYTLASESFGFPKPCFIRVALCHNQQLAILPCSHHLADFVFKMNAGWYKLWINYCDSPWC